LPKLALPRALSSFLFPDDEIIPAELQTDQTDTAAQSIVQPIIQPTLAPRSGTDTQSCHSTDNFLWTSWSILIKIPFIGSADCDLTYHALEHATTSITSWQCIEKNGFIQLNFNTAKIGYGGDINLALERRYPTVDNFNCPPD